MAGVCILCGNGLGTQHRICCPRQGIVTSDSCPSNDGAKREVVTKPARNIPENIPTQACQPEPDNSCNPQSLQQKLAGAILDSETLTGILLDIVQERCDQDRTWGGPATDDKHTGFDWVALVTQQLGRAVDGAFYGDAPEYCVAMVRAAALAVAAIQSVRRKAWAEGEQLSARDMSQ